MKLNHRLATVAGAAALGFVALPAQASPVSAGFAGTLQAASAPAAEVQLAHWDGRRYYYYGPGYRHRYYRHHFYGPRFGFYYGPRYHRRHHWYYRHW